MDDIRKTVMSREQRECAWAAEAQVINYYLTSFLNLK